MADANKDEILSILKKSTDYKEETDLEKDIREVKTDRKDDIKEIRNTLWTMTNLLILCNIGVFAVIIPLVLYRILK